jgi:nitrogen fixation/metabolism regulation signal transduction histidine kinase
VDLAVNFARDFALQTYSLQVERFENMVKEYDFDPLMASASNESPVLPEGIVGIQDFELQKDETWQSKQFLGEAQFKLRTLPALQQQVISRELPRDTDVIRYMLYPEKTIVRVVSYHLGTGFDAALHIIEIEKARFEIINSLKIRVTPLLVFYYGVFFFPILLMTLIIAISLTKRVSYPLVELTEATRRVAEGDFSIHIVARRNDELGLLIRSFNTMVRDLEKSQAALVKAEKISIWQNMAEQLAHEIKNPLTPIKLSAERVLRRWRKEPERIHEILESCMMDIIQVTEGLSTLLTEFRTLSRPMEPSLSWTSLQQLTEETVAPYRNSYPKVQFNMGHIDPGMVVKIDRQRLSQVLTNLIINGIDAMNGSGTIDIRTDLVKKWENQYCRLSISDTGKGITKQDSSQIFTPYFTTKASGTGLGLSIVERIVNEHGGTIWFNSAEGMGTTFFIDLPLQAAPAEGASLESAGEALFDPVSEQEGKGVQEKA